MRFGGGACFSLPVSGLETDRLRRETPAESRRQPGLATPREPTMNGKVYLVGAGPGDPELITVKGRRILQRADAVLYDHLASSALLDLAPAHAERVYVGKKKSAHEFTQEEICGMLIER